MTISFQHWIVALAILLDAAIGLAQGFDVDKGTPPPTQSGPMVYQRNSPLFEKYRLLIMPPCRDAVFNECSDWAINLLSYGGFVPVNIRMIEDTLFEIKLQSTSDMAINKLESNFRFPHHFELHVIFDADTVRYHVNFDVMNDSLTIQEDIRNAKVDFICLQPARKIPEDIGWIIFSNKDVKTLRKFRNEISRTAELINLDEGYYMCLPFAIKKARLSSFSVNKINNSYIQFFRVKEHDGNIIRDIFEKYPTQIANQIK